jgi:hypothetical protein
VRPFEFLHGETTDLAAIQSKTRTSRSRLLRFRPATFALRPVGIGLNKRPQAADLKWTISAKYCTYLEWATR